MEAGPPARSRPGGRQAWLAVTAPRETEARRPPQLLQAPEPQEQEIRHACCLKALSFGVICYIAKIGNTPAKLKKGKTTQRSMKSEI